MISALNTAHSDCKKENRRKRSARTKRFEHFSGTPQNQKGRWRRPPLAASHTGGTPSEKGRLTLPSPPASAPGRHPPPPEKILPLRWTAQPCTTRTGSPRKRMPTGHLRRAVLRSSVRAVRERQYFVRKGGGQKKKDVSGHFRRKENHLPTVSKKVRGIAKGGGNGKVRLR